MNISVDLKRKTPVKVGKKYNEMQNIDGYLRSILFWTKSNY